MVQSKLDKLQDMFILVLKRSKTPRKLPWENS